MPKSFTYFVMLITTHLTAVCQIEMNHWYFGNKAAIVFNGAGPPVSLSNSSMPTGEGCATISDSKGNLQFYTDGVTVWDASHSIMLNGSGLQGNGSTTQSSVIVHKPNEPDKYYLFTLSYPFMGASLRYTEIDMTANGGLGAVISKNNPLIPSTTLTEHMTVVRHADKEAYWLIVHGLNSSMFYSFKIDVSGISNSPVISSSGISHSAMGVMTGYLKGSPDGSKLAVAMLSTSMGTNGLELHDFDNSSGVVSNARYLDTTACYGVEFSPNGQLLYAFTYTPNNVRWVDYIEQYEISLPTIPAIIASKTRVSTGLPTGRNAIQRGPDNKLYFTSGANSYLGSIDNPNVIGLGCNVIPNAITLSGNSNSGLPNFISGVHYPYLLHDNYCLNDTTYFSFNDSSIISSAIWNFGDPLSGAANTSTSIEPWHIFSDTGTFIISAIIDFNFYYLPTVIHDTIWDTIRITTSMQPRLGNDTIICKGTSLQLKAFVPSMKYTWQDNSTKSTYLATDTGLYWVQLTDTNGCRSEKDSIYISHIPAINVPYDWSDTSLCTGEFLRLSATYPGVSYIWNDGSKNSFIDIFKEGKYWVKWENACEDHSDTMEVNFLKDIEFDLGNDSVFCFGDAFKLNADIHDEGTYLWQDGSDSNLFIATEPGRYYVHVENKCSELSDTIVLSQLFPPEVYLGEDTTLCRNSSIILDAANQGATYLWQDGSTGRYMRVTREGDYWVDVENDCAIDNDSLLALFTYPPQIELGEDTIICNGEQLRLDATNKQSTYLWQDGSMEPTIYADRAGTYRVEVTNACGTKTDQVKLDKEDCSCQVFLPNTFTPGGDNLNEEFRVYCPCDFAKFNLKVFNRWGELLYETNSPKAGWDGTMNGEMMPDGGYVWFLEYEAISDSGNKTGSKRGKVFLLR